MRITALGAGALEFASLGCVLTSRVVPDAGTGKESFAPTQTWLAKTLEAVQATETEIARMGFSPTPSATSTLAAVTATENFTPTRPPEPSPTSTPERFTVRAELFGGAREVGATDAMFALPPLSELISRGPEVMRVWSTRLEQLLKIGYIQPGDIRTFDYLRLFMQDPASWQVSSLTEARDLAANGDLGKERLTWAAKTSRGEFPRVYELADVLYEQAHDIERNILGGEPTSRQVDVRYDALKLALGIGFKSRRDSSQVYTRVTYPLANGYSRVDQPETNTCAIYRHHVGRDGVHWEYVNGEARLILDSNALIEVPFVLDSQPTKPQNPAFWVGNNRIQMPNTESVVVSWGVVDTYSQPKEEVLGLIPEVGWDDKGYGPSWGPNCGLVAPRATDTQAPGQAGGGQQGEQATQPAPPSGETPGATPGSTPSASETPSEKSNPPEHQINPDTGEVEPNSQVPPEGGDNSADANQDVNNGNNVPNY